MSVFGTSTAGAQNKPSLFTSLSVPANPAQPAQQNNPFGASQQQQTQAAPSMFGASTAGAGLGAPQRSSLFGGNPTAPTASLFGNTQNQQAAPSASLFGNNVPAQQAGLTQTPQAIATAFQQNQGSRIWNETDLPRQKSVAEQILLVYQKWDPSFPTSPFNTYLYNSVPTDNAPFYRPGPSDNEEKWEEALRKAPSAGSIPILVKGFQQLGFRIVNQESYLKLLHGRLHEINNGLTDLLRRHDLEISTRTEECKRRHIRLAQKCLQLATKTQVLRNRGYAMDSTEEELRQKLMRLEKLVLDPAIAGRGEEIWARMVGVRERARLLVAEYERVGRAVGGKEESLDDETGKKVKKILEDYDSQLTHLAKELKEIRTEFEEWEKGRPGASNGTAANGRAK